MKNDHEGKRWGNRMWSRLIGLFTPDESSDRSVFFNSLFLIGTTIGNSALGFLFWIIAARKYSVAEVGIGAAYVNTISLIALLADMGMGITLLRYIVSFEDQQRKFINSLILLEGFITLVMGILFVLGLPLWSKELHELSTSKLSSLLFVGSCVIFLLVNFLDNIFLAFNKAHFLFLRNILANVIRLLFLFFVSFGIGSMNIVLSVGIGAVLTLVLTIFFLLPRTVPSYSIRLEFSPMMIQGKLSYALSNQATQLIMVLTPFLFPLIIIRILGSEANAQFYICWMIANLLFVIPASIATSSFVKLAGDPKQDMRLLWKYLKQTLLGLAIVVPTLILISPWILALFGEKYRQVSGILNWFLASALPYAVILFVITYFRLRSKLRYLLIVSVIPSLLSLVLMTGGGMLSHLRGIGIGWLIAQSIGAVWSVFWLQRQFRNVTSI